jgi:anti-sigma regulatory factor (Ser/Thr protein kinase)
MSRKLIALPDHAVAGAAARHALAPAVRSLHPDRRADVLLLATELVSNAFRHGAPPIMLVVDSDGDRLRIEVEDAGAGRPARNPEPGPAGGWGLLLVEQSADRWGVLDGSTNVWFEIDL